MYAHDQHITWEQFEQKFRKAFGREMTPDEHEWFFSIWTAVCGDKQETSKAAVA